MFMSRFSVLRDVYRKNCSIVTGHFFLTSKVLKYFTVAFKGSVALSRMIKGTSLKLGFLIQNDGFTVFQITVNI